MISKTILTFAEVLETLEAVFAYNGKKAIDFVFRDADGNQIKCSYLEVQCEEANGLIVRVAPEITLDPAKTVKDMTARELAVLHE